MRNERRCQPVFHPSLLVVRGPSPHWATQGSPSGRWHAMAPKGNMVKQKCVALSWSKSVTSCQHATQPGQRDETNLCGIVIVKVVHYQGNIMKLTCVLLLCPECARWHTSFGRQDETSVCVCCCSLSERHTSTPGQQDVWAFFKIKVSKAYCISYFTLVSVQTR